MSTEENKTLVRRFCTALSTALDGRALPRSPSRTSPHLMRS